MHRMFVHEQLISCTCVYVWVGDVRAFGAEKKKKLSRRVATKAKAAQRSVHKAMIIKHIQPFSRVAVQYTNFGGGPEPSSFGRYCCQHQQKGVRPELIFFTALKPALFKRLQDDVWVVWCELETTHAGVPQCPLHGGNAVRINHPRIQRKMTPATESL
jgi:hypothetical protein